VSPLTEEELRTWPYADLATDTVPGMSIEKAYNEIIKNNKGQTVIVGVIDSGVDITHEDLDGVIWTNRDEKPNNGKDDDNNGYVDDIHGWNFIGDAVHENLEFVRIYKALKPKYDAIPTSSVPAADQEEFNLYQRAKAEYNKEYNETLGVKNQYEGIRQQLTASHEVASKALGKENYTAEDLAAWNANTPEMQQHKAFLSQVMAGVGSSIPDAIDQLEDAIEYYAGRL